MTTKIYGSNQILFENIISDKKSYISLLYHDNIWLDVQKYLWLGLAQKGERWWRQREEFKWSSIEYIVNTENKYLSKPHKQHKRCILILKWKDILKF